MAIPPEESGKKSGRRVILPAVLLIIAVIAILFYNNRRAYPVVDYDAVKKEAPKAGTPEETAPGMPPASDARPKTAPAGARLNAAFGPLVCATADSSRHCLQVGIRLMYSGAALDREIKDKKENIERLVKFVFSGKQLAEINADSARAELLGKINAFLSAGKADDLVFTAFDIIPMEMK